MLSSDVSLGLGRRDACCQIVSDVINALLLQLFPVLALSEYLVLYPRTLLITNVLKWRWLKQKVTAANKQSDSDIL